MKKNKLMLILFIFLLGFMYIFIGNKTNAANFSTDLTVMADKVEKQNAKITEWSLYTRETIEFSSQKEWLKKVDSLKKQFSNLSWEFRNGQDTLMAVGTLKHKKYVETIKIMSTPINGKFQSYLIYEVNGSSWNDQFSNKLDKIIGGKLGVLYSHKPVIFSCIKGEFNDKIDKVLSSNVEKLLTSLKAEEKEALKEKDFDSISAYSPLLSQSIPTKNTQMNMQIGVRKNGLGAKTTFVIGTPIITIEY